MQRITAALAGPQPVGPYSQAVVTGHLVFTAGQIPANPHGQIPANPHGQIPADFSDQVRQTLRNLGAVLEAAGSGLDRLVKVNAYLTDPAQLEPFNAVYRELLGHAPPARTTVCVQLWGVALEIDCVAAVREAP